jgi:hypothetical protein
MANDLSIQPTPQSAGIGATAAPQKSVASGSDVAVPPAQLYVNPEFKFDPTLGLVVIEFHNTAGALTNSIPNQHQLDAYRMHRGTPPGQPPPQGPDGKTSVG